MYLHIKKHLTMQQFILGWLHLIGAIGALVIAILVLYYGGCLFVKSIKLFISWTKGLF